jgi:hypothetical protein
MTEELWSATYGDAIDLDNGPSTGAIFLSDVSRGPDWHVRFGSFATGFPVSLWSAKRSLPLRKRPFGILFNLVAMGQQRTHAPQQNGSLFNHLVGAGE